MEQCEYGDTIDRLLNNELSLDKMPPHEKYSFLEAAKERSLNGDWESVNDDLEFSQSVLRDKRNEIKKLDDKVRDLNNKIREIKDYCSTWRSEASYTKAQLFEKLRKVENLLK